MHAITDDRPELTATGVDHTSLDRTTVRTAVVTQVRSDRACAEVHFFSQDGVSEVRKVADVGARQEDRVLDLDGLADVTLITDRSGAADVAIGPDLAVVADDHVAFDDDAREDLAAFADL